MLAEPTDRRAEFPEGARVRALTFALDEGLRIWPVEPERDVWRVVRVADQAVRTEFMRGTSQECQRDFPGAVFGINDNESVPPGTLGTVDLSDGTNLFVRWDNGRRLGVTPRDTIELVK